MAYLQGPPLRTRSIAEIYSGKLHSYSPQHHPPHNPYRQYAGILRFLRKELELRSAEQQHLKSEAEKKNEVAAEQKRIDEETNEDMERHAREVKYDREELEF